MCIANFLKKIQIGFLENTVDSALTGLTDPPEDLFSCLSVLSQAGFKIKKAPQIERRLYNVIPNFSFHSKMNSYGSRTLEM